MTITLSGHSDDLIEIDGDLSEEFAYNIDHGYSNYLALSNGAVFRIEYASDGCWRITPCSVPASVSWEKVEAVSADDDNYSDRVTVTGEVIWVVHGIGIAVP
jgi:hypothetical protein